ncbi:MAG: hypothetical protein ACKVKK_04155 [Flavobacteriales bacterium]|jgi:hypothetical protein|tara:strand:- start:422 stop:913 length:492 start_codon:yes stop_codon:yes gene_type:complete
MKDNHFNLIAIIVVVSLVVSCDFFGPSGLTSVEIKKASSWSSNDQPPTFPECETLNKKEQLDCLQEVLSNIITDQIAMSSPVSSFPLDEEVKLILKIDQEGVFSLVEAQISSLVKKAIPELKSILDEVIGSLPKALPAAKTNVGVYVESQLSLPIQIVAQPSK